MDTFYDNNLVWKVMVIPHTFYNGKPIKATSLYTTSPYSGGSYTSLAKGSYWVEYNDPRNLTNSIEVARDIMRTAMAKDGFSLEEVTIVGVFPADILVTPTY